MLDNMLPRKLAQRVGRIIDSDTVRAYLDRLEAEDAAARLHERTALVAELRAVEAEAKRSGPEELKRARAAEAACRQAQAQYLAAVDAWHVAERKVRGAGFSREARAGVATAALRSLMPDSWHQAGRVLDDLRHEPFELPGAPPVEVRALTPHPGERRAVQADADEARGVYLPAFGARLIESRRRLADLVREPLPDEELEARIAAILAYARTGRDAPVAAATDAA